MINKGFTLVEILIVVVILAILAAIVIPQFTGASTEAKESALVSDLQSIRSQVELFKIQHNDILPGEILQTNGTVTAATNAASVVNALTMKTDQYGNVSATATATYRFGPYMQKLPDNPFSTATVVVVADKSEGASSVELDGAAGNNGTGWNFVTTGATRGLFQANDGLKNPVTDQLHTLY